MSMEEWRKVFLEELQCEGAPVYGGLGTTNQQQEQTMVRDTSHFADNVAIERIEIPDDSDPRITHRRITAFDVITQDERDNSRRWRIEIGNAQLQIHSLDDDGKPADGVVLRRNGLDIIVQGTAQQVAHLPQHANKPAAVPPLLDRLQAEYDALGANIRKLTPFLSNPGKRAVVGDLQWFLLGEQHRAMRLYSAALSARIAALRDAP